MARYDYDSQLAFAQKQLDDARKRGETHQWMYDKINLTYYLKKSGFRDVKVQSYLSSDIENWIDYGLDTDNLKNEYRIGSLYMESRN